MLISIYLVILTIFVLVVSIVVNVNLHSSVKESQLRDKYKTDRIKDLESKFDVEVHQGNFYRKQLHFFYSLLREPLVAFAHGNIRKTYEVRSNNKIMTRVKVNKIGEPSLRKTFDSKLYFNVNGKYIDSEGVHSFFKDADQFVPLDELEGNVFNISTLKNMEFTQNLPKKK